MSNKKLLLIPFFLAAIFITACCSCGSGEENIVKGVITVIGNEPFAKLAVKVDDSKAYVLECDKELETELMKNQGYEYSIQFSKSRVENGIPVLVVEKAIPLKTNKN